MSRFPEAALFALAALIAQPAAGEFGLGRTATPDEIAAWDIDVRPDGVGLPEGSGNVAEGEEVFAERCAICHGDFAEGVDRWPVLAGGRGTLTAARPVKTVGSYWPYLSTVWDYVHRAMPFGDALSLTDDEVYAITAYILYSNDIVDDEFELSRENFLEVEMPNAGGFIPDDRTETAIFAAREPCMENCKDKVEITARAAVIDVTPEETAAKAAKEAEAGESEGVSGESGAASGESGTEMAAAAPDPALVAAGETAFKKCKACHAIGEGAANKVGPHLNALFGRAAGGLEGFRYSKAMTEAGEEGLVWDDATLAEFLTKPKAMIKKTKMSFAGFKKEEDIEAILAYLKASSE
jgi:cytochrome c